VLHKLHGFGLVVKSGKITKVLVISIIVVLVLVLVIATKMTLRSVGVNGSRFCSGSQGT